MTDFHSFWLILEATNAYSVTPQEAMGLLGLQQGYTTEQLDQAYRNAALNNHPDRGGDPIMFKKVQAAYETLKSKPYNTNNPNPGRQQARQQQPRPEPRQAYKTRPIPTQGGTKTLAGWEMEVMNAAKRAEQRGEDPTPIYQQMLDQMEAELERISNMPNPDPDSIARKNRLMRPGVGGVEGWRAFVSSRYFRRQRQPA